MYRLTVVFYVVSSSSSVAMTSRSYNFYTRQDADIALNDLRAQHSADPHIYISASIIEVARE